MQLKYFSQTIQGKNVLANPDVSYQTVEFLCGRLKTDSIYRKEKSMKRLLVVYIFAMPMLLVGCESAQQKAYDLKADTIGTHRVVEVYTEAGNKIATIEDESMRYEMVGERSVRLWLGDKNEKVMIGNMGFIITDK